MAQLVTSMYKLYQLKWLNNSNFVCNINLGQGQVIIKECAEQGY